MATSDGVSILRSSWLRTCTSPELAHGDYTNNVFVTDENDESGGLRSACGDVRGASMTAIGATQVESVIAGAAAWSICLWLGQPIGLALRVCNTTPIVGPVLGVATVVTASIAAGEVARAVTAANWGRPRFDKFGRRPPKSKF